MAPAPPKGGCCTRGVQQIDARAVARSAGESRYRGGMRGLFILLLVLCAIGGGFFGLAGITAGQSAVQEIEGLIGVLIFTVAAGYIVSAIDEHRLAAFPKPAKPAPPQK